MEPIDEFFILDRQVLIDQSTEKFFYSRKHDGKRLSLVMSDEFTSNQRGFGRGEDRFFEAINRPDTTNEALQFYKNDQIHVTTENGSLILRATADPVEWTNTETMRNESRGYSSAMIQSWNKFCFTGGVLEVSAQFPAGKASSGLWPAVWLMGNLGRATYTRSTDNIWPWSYDRCTNTRQKQRISACELNSKNGLGDYQGRGAPEMDLFEFRQGRRAELSKEFVEGKDNPFVTASMQIAPGIAKSVHPMNGVPLHAQNKLWYDVTLGEKTSFNEDYWGFEMEKYSDSPYMVDSLSAKQLLEDSYFDIYHTYTLEWQPPSNDGANPGYVSWYHDGNLMLHVEGTSISNLTGAQIPAEPMYLIFNIAMSRVWGLTSDYAIDDFDDDATKRNCERIREETQPCFDCHDTRCKCWLPPGLRYNCSALPGELKIDYVRLFQDFDDPLHTVGCSPLNFPTEEYINAHYDFYQDWKTLTRSKNRESSAILSFGGTTIEICALVGILFLLIGILARKNSFRVSCCRKGYQPIPDCSEHTSPSIPV